MGHVRLELEGGLKAIDHQAQYLVDFAQLLRCLHSDQTRTAHRLAHHGSILLLDTALIVLYPWAPVHKSEVFLPTIREHLLIKELRAAIGVDAQQGKRQELASLL